MPPFKAGQQNYKSIFIGTNSILVHRMHSNKFNKMPLRFHFFTYHSFNRTRLTKAIIHKQEVGSKWFRMKILLGVDFYCLTSFVNPQWKINCLFSKKNIPFCIEIVGFYYSIDRKDYGHFLFLDYFFIVRNWWKIPKRMRRLWFYYCK